MKLSIVTKIPHSAQACYEAMRDEMPNLAKFMPNIQKIDVIAREDDADGVRLTNQWYAAGTEIPTLARPFVDPDRVFWLDHAHWLAEGYRCQWRRELGFLTDRVSCKGFTFFTPTSEDSCQMEIDGDLTLDLKGLVPRLMVGRATKGVEQFILKMMEPNFRRMGQSLTDFLNARS